MRLSFFCNSRFLPGLVIFFVMISCSSQVNLIHNDSWYHDDLTSLSEAITERDSEILWEFTRHQNEMAANMAWKALAMAEIDDVEKIITYAINYDDLRAWFVLSFQDLNSMESAKIRDLFFDGILKPENICEFYSRKGDDEVLKFLLSNPDLIIQNETCSKAAGGIISRVELEEEFIGEIFRFVFGLEDETALRNILYGFWRTPLNRPNEFSSSFKMLIELVYSRASEPATLTDEYLIALTGEPGFNAVMQRRSLAELYENTQLAVVTASVLSRFNSDDLNIDHVLKFLNHPNPHVVIQTLESLKQIDAPNPDWVKEIENHINHYPNNAEVVLTYIELLLQNGLEINDYGEMIRSIDQENSYLTNRTLPLIRHFINDEDYLAKIEMNLQTEGIEAMNAARALEQFVSNESNSIRQKEKIRNLLLNALDQQNRSVLAVTGSLFRNDELFSEIDLDHFLSSYGLAKNQNNRAIMAELSEIIQYYGGTVDDSVILSDPIQKPDWQLLRKIGDSPNWILETNRGDIVVRLEAREAPFTVSSVIYLTDNGFYDEVNFHRVVRNFVIQGGDFERRDGLGGPDYRIPTEPSFKTFSKGMAGMASSGPDTEGSQFFFTHTWTPHLDGLYTIFGEVIEGIDVVEKIQIGDNIKRARVEY